MTLVKFLIHKIDGEILAMFPQLNYNKRLYGNTMKTGYIHIGQHTVVAYDLATPADDNPWVVAGREQYSELLQELKNIGYNNLKVLNK